MTDKANELKSLAGGWRGACENINWRGARSTESLSGRAPNTYVAQLDPSSASPLEHHYSFVYNIVIIYWLIVPGAQKSLSMIRNLKRIVLSYACILFVSLCVIMNAHVQHLLCMREQASTYIYAHTYMQ